MMGIVFNLLEQCVAAEHGEDLWDDLLDAAGLEGAYTALGNYPDEQLVVLVGAAARALEISPGEVERWFGRVAMQRLAERYAVFFEHHGSTLPFVLTLNDIIHPEVRKLYPGAVVPEFELDATGETGLTMRYRSPRQMCAFAEGLLLGAADHYGEHVAVEHRSCMKDGDQTCTMSCSFGPAADDG